MTITRASVQSYPEKSEVCTYGNLKFNKIFKVLHLAQNKSHASVHVREATG